MKYFRDKSVLITGATSGIGWALAMELNRQGAIVYATGTNDDNLKLIKEKAPAPDKMIPIVLNVTSQEHFESCIQQIVEACGTLDFMFNNAGIMVGGDFNEMTDEQCKAIMDINLMGVIHGTRAAYRVMRQQRAGQIVNVSSSAGLIPVPLSTPYCATKHAVVGLTISLREEARLHNIKVNLIIPGIVDTSIFSRALNIKDYNYKKNIEELPLKAISPQQAARAIIKGVEKNRREIIFPLYNQVLMGLYRLMPGFITKLLSMNLILD